MSTLEKILNIARYSKGWRKQDGQSLVWHLTRNRISIYVQICFGSTTACVQSLDDEMYYNSLLWEGSFEGKWVTKFGDILCLENHYHDFLCCDDAFLDAIEERLG